MRNRLNTASSLSELHNILVDENLMFSPHDFDEAFHHCLTQCQEAKEAEQLKEFELWWNLLFKILDSTEYENIQSICSMEKYHRSSPTENELNDLNSAITEISMMAHETCFPVPYDN